MSLVVVNSSLMLMIVFLVLKSTLTLEEVLFDCSIRPVKLPRVFLLEVYYLTVNKTSSMEESTTSTTKRFPNVHLGQIPGNASRIEDLRQSNLDPTIPFIFFTNGYNNYDTVNETWMYAAADSVLKHQRLSKENSLVKANYILLHWRMTTKDEALDLVPGLLNYYIVMAYYEMMVDHFYSIVDTVIDFVEEAHEGLVESKAKTYELYSEYAFFGHSLGAHILAHAINRVRRKRPSITFGRLSGLDPAITCFNYNYLGLSKTVLQNSVKRIDVIHTETTFFGDVASKGSIDIFVNGGSVQPNCSWYDIQCHHSRSAGLFAYFDRECRMIAYKCDSLQQFRLGACDTYESTNTSKQTDEDSNYVLVNLKGQSIESDEILSFQHNQNQLRHLADGYLTRTINYHSEKDITRQSSRSYYVNTNPNYKTGLMTHCLQHYQLRMILLSENLINLSKCKLGSFSSHFKGLDIKMLYEVTTKDKFKRSTTRNTTLKYKEDTFYKTLTNVYKDKLYTGLINFEGEPKLYVGAVITGIDMVSWLECLVKEELQGNLRFVLDIAFMSHTNEGIRHAYSSVLCGQWNSNDNSLHDEIGLDLCKISELETFSDQIDEYLKSVNFQSNSWQATLLENLFFFFLNRQSFG